MITFALALVLQEASFPLKVGARWEYKGTKHEKRVAATETWDIVKVEKKNGVECHLLRIASVVDGKKGDGVELYVRLTPEGLRIEDAPLKSIGDEERYLVLFPLKKGAKGSVYHSAPAEAVVEAEAEKTVVPAGTYVCAVRQYASSYPGMSAESRQWFAPGVGFIKFQTTWKREGAAPSVDLLELVSFTPGK